VIGVREIPTIDPLPVPLPIPLPFPRPIDPVFSVEPIVATVGGSVLNAAGAGVLV
jgi:hypothetical protein